MKKFLYCIVFLIAFSGISSIVLNANGFDGENRQIKTEITSYQELTNEEKSELDADISDKANNAGKTKIVYDVVLFEFSDYKGYFTEEKLKAFNTLFNEYNLNNKDYSVNEYFKDISYGQVEINANIYLYKDSKPKSYYEPQSTELFPLEYATYQKAKIKSKTIYDNYGEGNATMIIFSGEKPKNNNTRLWAHAYTQSTFVSLTYEHADVGTLCHEILHTFGLSDLYTYNTSLPTPVDCWDVSANGGYYYSNNLMYNKLNIGWVDVSNYEDDKQTEIETISKNGTYTLNPTTSLNGTRAYKFGMKKGDEKVYFMAEYRKGLSNRVDDKVSSGLIVYRVNENKKLQGNLQATTYKDFEIYIYRYRNSTYCTYASYSAGSIGSLIDSNAYLFYDDKTVANYVIENITIDNSSGTLSFDFKNYEDNQNYVAGKVYKKSGVILPNADIYINGIKATTTNSKGVFIIENVRANSTLTVVAPDTSLIYAPVIVNPGDKSIELYADKTSYARVCITDGQANDTYTLFKYSNSEWTQVGTFKGNDKYFTIPNARVGEKYKVIGNLVDEEFIISRDDYFKYIKKQEPKKEETKSTTEKITDTITSIPSKVKNTLEDAYNTIKDSVSGAFNGFARWLGF